LDLLGLRWDSQGAGRVVSQDPPAGTPLSDVSVCRLVFSNQPTEKEIDKVEKSSQPGRM
jgi:beta-lactam-binding protein with PASTA domain